MSGFLENAKEKAKAVVDKIKSYGKENISKENADSLMSQHNRSNINEAEEERKAIKEANKNKAENAWKAENNINQKNKEEEAKAIEEADKKKKEQEKLSGLPFDEYASNDTFNNGYSTADELVKKGKESGKNREEILEAIKNTSWGTDKRGNVARALDKYFPKPAETEAPASAEIKEAPKEVINDNGKFEEKGKGLNKLFSWLKEHKGGFRTLGEAIATTIANASNGARAGFSGTPFTPTAYKTLERAWERDQRIKDTEAEGKAEVKKQRETFNTAVSSSPILNSYSSEIKNKLVDLLLSGNTSRGDFEKIIGKTGSEADEAYNSFRALGNLKSITDNSKNVVELNGQKFNIVKDKTELITKLEATITDLQKKKVEASTIPYDNFVKLVQDYKGIYAGIQRDGSTINKATGSNTEFGGSLNISGGIPVVRGGVTASASHGSSKNNSESNYSSTDTLALQGIAEGKDIANEYKQNANGIIKAYNASIDATIEEIRKQIEAIKNYSINDGIVKGKGIAQKIIRADGTEINLNPNDNIYATTKEITSLKDDGSNVIPMEKEDKAIVLQKRLGYNSNPINKDFGYYLEKLRG